MADALLHKTPRNRSTTLRKTLFGAPCPTQGLCSRSHSQSGKRAQRICFSTRARMCSPWVLATFVESSPASAPVALIPIGVHSSEAARQLSYLRPLVDGHAQGLPQQERVDCPGSAQEDPRRSRLAPEGDYRCEGAPAHTRCPPCRPLVIVSLAKKLQAVKLEREAQDNDKPIPSAFGAPASAMMSSPAVAASSVTRAPLGTKATSLTGMTRSDLGTIRDGESGEII